MGDKKKNKYRDRRVKLKKEEHSKKSKRDNWFIKISIASFFISTFVSMISSKILEDLNLIVAFLMLLVIIIIGIIFDMIGISVTAADETPFHAMASRKKLGAKQAIRLIRNANKVSSFCNDVVGDICGVLSGSIGALMVIGMSEKFGWGQAAFLGFIFTGLIASMTIGGKALGKTFAIEKSSSIVHKVGSLLNLFTNSVKRNPKTFFNDIRKKR